MQRIASRKRFGALAAAVLVLAACSGDKGDPGAAGATGPQGPQGPGGTSAGTVAGVVTVAGTSPDHGKFAGSSLPLPATVVMIPSVPIRRIRRSPESAR